jgi:hypothetical protein
MDVVPAVTAEPVAHLHQPHRVVGVEQRAGGFGEILRDQLENDEQPRNPKQERETRLAHGGGHAPVSGNSVEFRLINGPKYEISPIG